MLRAASARVRARPTLLPSLLVVAMLASVELFPDPMPVGVYLSGVVFGTWTGLVALALVLVFASNRIVNFAAYQVGATSAVVFAELLSHHPLARLFTGRFSGHQVFPHWALTAEWWTAALLSVGLAALLSTVTYALLVRRLAEAPPLVGTVATVAVSVMLAELSTIVVHKVVGDHQLIADTSAPQRVSVTLGGGVFHLPQLLTLGVGLLALPALALFLRRSRVGTGMRAAAANPERAGTLGVDASRVTAVVWAIAGALAGLAAVLNVASNGANERGGEVSMVAVLAAVVLAATISRPLAFAAAVATGVLQQGMLWSFGRGELVNAVLLGLVLVVLLLRRRPVHSRVDLTDSSWRAAREVRPVPAELRGHRDVRRLRHRVAVSAALAAAAFPWLMPNGQVQTGTLVLVIAMVGLSLLVLTGWGGLISLGQFAFAAVGGWVAAVLSGQGVSVLLALPLAAAAGGAVALVLGLPALRVRGLYLAILTLAFAVVVSGVLLDPRYGGQALPSVLDRPTLFGLPTSDERAYYYLTLLITAASAVAVAGLRRSRSARALIAARDNERAAEVFGVDLVRARLSAFVLSGVVAALAGALYAFQQRGVEPGNFGPQQSLLVFLVVVLGGLGSLAGPVLGAVLYGVLLLLPQSVLTDLTLPVAVVVVLVAAPGGLTQGVFAVRDLVLRRIAVRDRIAVPSLFGALDTVSRRRARLAPRTGTGYVAQRYALPHEPLEVPRVAATGRGA